MKKITLLILLFVNVVFGAPLQYMVKYIQSGTPLEIANTPWVPGSVTTLPFDFWFGANIYNQVYISTKGMITFLGNNETGNNTLLPYTGETAAIFPFWDNLKITKTTEITYQIKGVAPNRYLLITWKDIKSSSGNILYTFETLLYENGNIRFRYDENSGIDGLSATVGVQEIQLFYDQHLFETPLDATKDILYVRELTPLNAAIFFLKSSIVISDVVNLTNNPKRIPGSIIRYCFDIQNTGEANADNIVINDTIPLSASFIKAGKVVQEITTPCACSAITDTTGTNIGQDVSIPVGTLTGILNSATSKSCAYIEVNLN